MRTPLKILLAAALLTNFAEGIYTPLYAAYVSDIGGELSDAGVSWSLNLIAYGVLAVMFSRLGTQKRYRILLLSAGYFLGALATIMFAVISTPILLYVVQLLRGVSWAMIAPVWDAFYSLYLDKRNLTVQWGYYEGGWSIATGLGSAIGGILITLFSFQTLFLISAVLNAVAGLLVLVYRNEFY